MFRQISFGLAALFFASIAQAELSDTEKLLISFSEQHSESAIQLLEESVNINSGTMNHEGVRKVGDVFRRELDHLGFETIWHDMSEVNRAGHLFAEKPGAGRCLLLIGHLDTVFEKDSSFQRFERTGDVATGPGVNDMKGGNVVIIYALKALDAAGALEDKNIIVAFTGDEEKSGNPKSISRYHLVDAAKRCEIALGFEGATSFNEATVARRSSSSWMLEVEGMRAHSSAIFRDRVGSGAIFEAARILNAFHEEVKGEEYLTFNPGVILGGTEVEYDPSQNRGNVFGKTNVVSQKVVVHGGIRTIADDQLEKARASMRKIVENGNRPQTSAKISFSDGYPSMPPTEGNLAVLNVLSGLSEDLGHGKVVPYDPGKRGAADVSFVADYVDALDGIGVKGDFSHTPNERIDLTTLPALIQRSAILIHRLSMAEL